jgi:hypothetical protein
MVGQVGQTTLPSIASYRRRSRLKKVPDDRPEQWGTLARTVKGLDDAQTRRIIQIVREGQIMTHGSVLSDLWIFFPGSKRLNSLAVVWSAEKWTW